MPSTVERTILGVRFEFTRYRDPKSPRGHYYRVGVEDSESPVGICFYLNQFPTVAKATAFARNIAQSHQALAMAG